MSVADSSLLRYEPRWSSAREVRLDLTAVLRDHNISGDDLDTVTMVGSELAENAIKYGSYQSGETFSVELRIQDGGIVELEVCNPAGSDEHLDRLLGTLAEIREAADPTEPFQNRMLELAARGVPRGESGLGLVRMAGEGGALLRGRVLEDRTLCVIARYQLAG